MKLLTMEIKRMGVIVGVIAVCVISAWVSVYFLGPDNPAEEEFKEIEIEILENELHLSPEQAEKDADLTMPKKKENQKS